jgi:hypothetical protein
MFGFVVFSVQLLMTFMTFLQCSFHCQKAVTKCSNKRVVIAPSLSFLRVSWLKVMLVSLLLILGMRKKSPGARFRDYGRCWMILNCLGALQLVPIVAVCMVGLSQ